MAAAAAGGGRDGGSATVGEGTVGTRLLLLMMIALSGVVSRGWGEGSLM